MGFTFSQSADAASINCSASAGSYALEDQIEYNDKLSCRYGSGGYFWLQWDFFVDENFACTGKEHTTPVFTYISSKTHLAHVHYEPYYEKNVKQAAIQLLHDFESKNIATSCSGQNNAEDKQFQNNCPTGYILIFAQMVYVINVQLISHFFILIIFVMMDQNVLGISHIFTQTINVGINPNVLILISHTLVQMASVGTVLKNKLTTILQ